MNFYKSKEWQKFINALKLERVNDKGELLCEECGKPIIKAYDCIGHHKIELNDSNINDPTITLNPDNVMLVHHECHNKIHRRFGYSGLRKVFLVYGSPCAGKSTWVNNVAGYGDIIMDMDSIWECITNSDKYHKPDALKRNVFAIRDVILEQIMMRVGNWSQAFVIGGYPNKMDRERLADKLGAELIHIDTDKETCLSRAKNDEWRGFIQKYFDEFTG